MGVKYNSSDEILEFIVKGPSGEKLDVRRTNKQDEEEGGKILRWLFDKWGWRPKIQKKLIDVESEFLKF